ncbi:MAG TPA: UvrB/UvrC motif-containing protein [Spirochaetia bacterium]|nr:UvrB/UvrC motif-containing protein [Spirochaetia bacterium]
MSDDITHILTGWEYDPNDTTRIIKADDGRDVLQVRQPLGVEQYELEGRPDGLRPEGWDCYLDVIIDRIEGYTAANGTDKGFTLSREDYLHLQNEGIIYYYRYLILFQMGDFERTIKDTNHNLQLADLIEKYAENEKEKKEILQYRPYILRINAISKAMISLNQQLKSVAAQILESAIELIQNMPNIETPAFKFEKLRSLHSLKSTLKQIIGKKATPLDKLREELKKAVDSENYEQAAGLRDQIEELEKEQTYYDDNV